MPTRIVKRRTVYVDDYLWSIIEELKTERISSSCVLRMLLEYFKAHPIELENEI